MIPNNITDNSEQYYAALVALILSWPCPTCGKPGLCSCITASTGNLLVEEPIEAAPAITEDHTNELYPQALE